MYWINELPNVAGQIHSGHGKRMIVQRWLKVKDKNLIGRPTNNRFLPSSMTKTKLAKYTLSVKDACLEVPPGDVQAQSVNMHNHAPIISLSKP